LCFEIQLAQLQFFHPMSEFQPLIDQLYIEEVLRARALGPEGRMREGFEISEQALEWAESMGQEEMERRFRIVRELDEQGCYGPPFPRI
jgi:hypothetical protein